MADSFLLADYPEIDSTRSSGPIQLNLSEDCPDRSRPHIKQRLKRLLILSLRNKLTSKAFLHSMKSSISLTIALSQISDVAIVRMRMDVFNLWGTDGLFLSSDFQLGRCGVCATKAQRFLGEMKERPPSTVWISMITCHASMTSLA
jgi:hypothetical protein